MKIKFLPHSIFILLFTCALSAFGQKSGEIVTSLNNQTITADENFQLNIVSDRITETNFTRSTNVKLNADARGGLRVEIGVGVRAERIDILLRGIFGDVRFRASLEPVKNRIEKSLPDAITPPR